MNIQHRDKERVCEQARERMHKLCISFQFGGMMVQGGRKDGRNWKQG